MRVPTDGNWAVTTPSDGDAHVPRSYRMALRSVDEWNDEHRMDDIVVKDVDTFRMEQMDKRSWWMACYLDPNADQRLTFWVTYNKKTKEIEVHVTEYPIGDHVYEGDSKVQRSDT